MKLLLGCLLLPLLFLTDCRDDAIETDPLQLALSSSNRAIVQVMEDPATYELQILYTRINRKGDSILFRDYSYRLDPEMYFYPASTVKLPVAALALEKLSEMDSLGLHTRYYPEGDTTVASFAEDIRRIFSISDNQAHNRLFEFLGQDDINQRLQAKKAGPARIAHRLGLHDDDITTRPLVVFLNDSSITLSEPIINTIASPLQLNGITKGTGYMVKDSLYPGAFDFSKKNYYPLQTQHEILKRLLFPIAFHPSERFNIREELYSFLLNSMKLLPREAGYEVADYPDSYAKFFIYGDSDDSIPPNMEIYNKVGFAYGTLTDCAYIRDSHNKVEFLLSATVLVNSNEIFNDDVYEYETVGIPFLAALGRELYAYEINQQKNGYESFKF